MAVATWMMAAYMDSIPISLEEAAWIDGASLFGGFVQVVLRNSLPGVLSTAIFTFLVSWNDYLVAIVFLRSATAFTLPARPAVVLPAEHHRLGRGHGRRRGHDAPARARLRPAEQVLQRRRHRRLARRPVARPRFLGHRRGTDRRTS